MRTLRRTFLLALGFVLFFPLFANAQYTGVWEDDNDSCNGNIYYGLGKVGINMVPGYELYNPNLLLHSYECPTDSLHPAVFRLQTAAHIDTAWPEREDYFGQAKIEFWSNEYQDDYEWMVGKIESFNAAIADAVLDSNNNTDFHGGLKFYCSGGPGWLGADNNSLETIRIVDGKVGIGFGYLDIFNPVPTIPEYLLDIRGNIGVGGRVASFGDVVDGSITIKSSLDDLPLTAIHNSRFHIYNSSSWIEIPFLKYYRYGLNISFGGSPGYCLHENDTNHIDESNFKGITDIVTFLGLETFSVDTITKTYGKMVGIGCNPYRHHVPAEEKTYDFDGAGTTWSPHLWGPAGPIGKLTVSDEPFPYWDGDSWEKYQGADVILRLERRNFHTDSTNYKLISAGHDSSETFIVNADGDVEIDGDLDITGKINFTDFTLDHWTVTPRHGLKTEGRVSIGPDSLKGTSPYYNAYMLAVSGIIVTTELVISDSSAEWASWSDFVFDDDYKLTPLEELEQSIKKNKHLPDIPSAEEVQEKGINVGRMQAKMLQKIEELTLYVIDLKKENKAMQKQIDALNKK